MTPHAPHEPTNAESTRHDAGVSVLILTKDEETNIDDCLRSVSFSDDIVVLDSCSTDRTQEIARSHPNVRVFERPFDTEWKQRNFGLQDIEYKHAWVYICDADERVPDELRDELICVAGTEDNPYAAYRLRYKNFFLGRWVRRSTGYPVWVVRLVRPDKVHYEVRETNVHPIVEGELGALDNHFEHYSFNTGLVRWFLKHNYYSEREALEGVRVRAEHPSKFADIFDKDPLNKRRAMKNLAFGLKFRALWRFLYSYFLRMGFLDGMPGFHYCAMIAMYEYWIEIKIVEQERGWGKKTQEIVESMLAEGNT